MNAGRGRGLDELQAEESGQRSRGDYEAALRTLDRMLAIDASFSPALNNKGGILLAQDRFAEALPLFVRATQADRSNGVAWNNQGLCLHNLGQPEEALEQFERAWDAGYRHEGVLYNTGVAHFACGNITAGLECWRQSLAINPFQSTLLEELGKLAQATGASIDPDPDILVGSVLESLSRIGDARVMRAADSGHFMLEITAGGTVTLLTFD
jgi:tetratricopeptide (TPR) repeat protein